MLKRQSGLGTTPNMHVVRALCAFGLAGVLTGFGCQTAASVVAPVAPSTATAVSDCRAIFAADDRNKDGLLTDSEAASAPVPLTFDQDSFNKKSGGRSDVNVTTFCENSTVFRAVDANGDGRISFDEYRSYEEKRLNPTPTVTPVPMPTGTCSLRDSDYQARFTALDTNRDGFLEYTELWWPTDLESELQPRASVCS